MQLLTVLASSSAIAEIGASPLVGGLTDSFGRKPILLGTLCIALLSNLLVAIYPSVPSLALAKFVSAIVIGLFFLTGGAVLADNYRTDQKKLAAVSGILFAVVNLGFGLGVALSGAPWMPKSIRGKYAASVGVGCVALLVAAAGVYESLPESSRVPFKARSFNPFAFVRLLSASRKMRNLGILAALATAPIFMGDTLQVFAIKQWALGDAQIAQLFTGVAVSGVLANVCGGPLIKLMGLARFTLLATCSTLIFWLGFSSASLKLAILGGIVGFLGPARIVGATAMMTSEGSRLNIPQGELSGDRANMNAWLKVIGPIVYGQLYVRGVAAGVPTAPFYLNVVLAIAALVMAQIAFADGDEATPK